MGFQHHRSNICCRGSKLESIAPTGRTFPNLTSDMKQKRYSKKRDSKKSDLKEQRSKKRQRHQRVNLLSDFIMENSTAHNHQAPNKGTGNQICGTNDGFKTVCRTSNRVRRKKLGLQEKFTTTTVLQISEANLLFREDMCDGENLGCTTSCNWRTATPS